MARTRVYVELDDQDQIIRIYRRFPPFNTNFREVPRVYAVGVIRQRILERAEGRCEYCGKFIDYHFHMHEKKPRGRGGEISMENSVALCASCHIGQNGEHGMRRPLFSKSFEGTLK